MLRFGLLLALVSGGRAHAQCDPYSQERELEIPKQLRLASTCGNGRIDTYAVSCTLHTSGGCGLPDQSSTVCAKTVETCDGRALGANTCQTLGYVGGKLRCAASCLDYVVDACTLCPAGGGCRERRISAADFADLRLFAQGEAVRAYWTDRRSLKSAEVDAKGDLGRVEVVAPIQTQRLIPVQVGASAMTLTGDVDHPELTIVKANGDLERRKLAGRTGVQMFMPIVPAGKLAVVVVADLFQTPVVTIVDESGAEQASRPLYAYNDRRAIVIDKLAPGKHHARWSKFEDDFTAQPGDMLIVLYDMPQVWLGVLRKGTAVWPFAPTPKAAAGAPPGFELPDVTLDGRVIMTFNYAEQVVFGQHRSIIPVKPAHVFAP
ncbi:MAG: hypothetical protein ABI678_31880, partial [Kofleriaceae bacterium]